MESEALLGGVTTSARHTDRVSEAGEPPQPAARPQFNTNHPRRRDPLRQVAFKNALENAGFLNAFEVAMPSLPYREAKCSQPTGLQTWSHFCSWWWGSVRRTLPTTTSHTSHLPGTLCQHRRNPRTAPFLLHVGI